MQLHNSKLWFYNVFFCASTRKEIHSAPVIGTMSSDSDKDVEEEEGIEDEDEMFPHMSSGSSTGEETGNPSDILQQSY